MQNQRAKTNPCWDICSACGKQQQPLAVAIERFYGLEVSLLSLSRKDSLSASMTKRQKVSKVYNKHKI